MSDTRIKAIDSTSIHRIHSGQVVLDLQGAVKELVENSLDAGATSIEVRLKDNGLESIEVVDNGSGIEQDDWPSIGLKHHTSKLPSLEELALVSTFGFRGEALSALCALCESVTVVTATKETAPMGAVLTLGRDGRVLDDSKRIARQRGTTITLNGLFRPLPVRRKEFERTAKREFTKALGMLTAYALVPASANPATSKLGVRLKVEQTGGGRGGKRNTVLVTDGKGALKSSVNAVWGPKALEGVIDVDLELDVEVDRAMARREGLVETSQVVRVTGLISSGAWGQGRSSADRQYIYVNGRPCNLPKVVKAVNEVYKSFNTNQVPLALLDFQIPKESVDINVSPDKRTLFLHSEANLIESLKAALESFFQPTRSTFAVAGAATTVKLLQTLVTEDNMEEDASEGAVVENHGQPAESEPESEGETELSQPSVPSRSSSRRSTRRRSPPGPTIRRITQQTLDTTVASWSTATQTTQTATASITTIKAPASGREARSDLRHKLAEYASQRIDVEPVSEPESEEARAEHPAPEVEEVDEIEETDDIELIEAPPRQSVTVSSGATPLAQVLPDPVVEEDELEDTPAPILPQPEPITHLAEEPSLPTDTIYTAEDAPSPASDIFIDEHILNDISELDNGMDIDARGVPEQDGYRDEILSSGATGEVTLQFDIARLRERYAARRSRRTGPEVKRDAFTALNGAVTKAAGVQNRDAAEAEAALARVIRKDDFARMEALGQFNKGFIIARLKHDDEKHPSDDLFIVDQHASDEKYNFETLQRTTVIKAQALIRPRPMQLTAADEIVAMENMDVLHANGFDVNVDEDAAPGRGERISLKAMPVSKETTFDMRDLEQLLHLLSDSARPAGQMVRCTKARSMFAMRACRRSVMIGKSLTKAQMVALLRNMGTIDQPWNCPHGRPTMRHLCSLKPPTRENRIDWSLS